MKIVCTGPFVFRFVSRGNFYMSDETTPDDNAILPMDKGKLGGLCLTKPTPKHTSTSDVRVTLLAVLARTLDICARVLFLPQQRLFVGEPCSGSADTGTRDKIVVSEAARTGSVALGTVLNKTPLLLVRTYVEYSSALLCSPFYNRELFIRPSPPKPQACSSPARRQIN